MSEKLFDPDMTYLPITMAQFEALTNEILVEVNKLTETQYFDGDYMAQVVMGAIHGLKHDIGRVGKTDLFMACMNRISNHLTFHAVEAIKAKMKAKAEAEGGAVTQDDEDGDSPIRVVPNDEVQH